MGLLGGGPGAARQCLGAIKKCPGAIKIRVHGGAGASVPGNQGPPNRENPQNNLKLQGLRPGGVFFYFN